MPLTDDARAIADDLIAYAGMLGACPPDQDFTSSAGKHSPQAVLDGSVIPDGAALLTESTLRRLRRAGDRRTAGPTDAEVTA